MSNLATMKVRGDVHRWLKAEAARRGVPLYQLVEDIIEDSFGRRAWDTLRSARAITIPSPFPVLR